MDALKKKLRKFNQERDWEQFHTPENLAKSIAIEAGELLECFQWNSDCDKQAVGDEIADVICYCVMLADKLDVDLPKAIEEKIEKNAAKYPVEKCKGSSKKYDEI